MLKAKRQIAEVHFSKVPERCYLETVLSCEQTFQAPPCGAGLLCDLSVGQWVAKGHCRQTVIHLDN